LPQLGFVKSVLIALGMHLLLRGAQLSLKLLDRFVGASVRWSLQETASSQRFPGRARESAA
jgi:hypothetical protein